MQIRRTALFDSEELLISSAQQAWVQHNVVLSLDNLRPKLEFEYGGAVWRLVSVEVDDRGWAGADPIYELRAELVGYGSA